MYNWSEELTKSMLDIAVKEAVAFYGVEGAEATIKRVYNTSNMHRLRDKYLETLYRTYGFGKKIR